MAARKTASGKGKVPPGLARWAAQKKKKTGKVSKKAAVSKLKKAESKLEKGPKKTAREIALEKQISKLTGTKYKGRR